MHDTPDILDVYSLFSSCNVFVKFDLHYACDLNDRIDALLPTATCRVADARATGSLQARH